MTGAIIYSLLSEVLVWLCVGEKVMGTCSRNLGMVLLPTPRITTAYGDITCMLVMVMLVMGMLVMGMLVMVTYHAGHGDAGHGDIPCWS